MGARDAPPYTQADCLPDPNDVFLFLQDKGIGQTHALFYEAYATYHELRGNCAAAATVFEQGISRCVGGGGTPHAPSLDSLAGLRGSPALGFARPQVGHHGELSTIVGGGPFR